MSLFEKRVEAAAGGMWGRYGSHGMFAHAPKHRREAFKADARAALLAADAVVTEEMIAEALHGDACPDDPDEGDTCSRDGADFRRQASVVAALVTGGAK